jgi:hypothetical protein
MAFWDGTRWIRPAGRSSDSGPRRRAKDWLATGVILVMAIGIAIPLTKSNAGLPSLTLSPASAAVGDRVTASGHDLPPRTAVRIAFDGQLLDAKGRVSPGGLLELSFSVPPAAEGPHSVEAVAAASGNGRMKSLSLGAILGAGVLTITAPAQATVAPTASPSATPAATVEPTVAPTPQTTSSVAVTPSPSASASQSSEFIWACGMSFCAGSSGFALYGASVFNGLDDPRASTRLAMAAGMNTVRVVNFLYEYDPVEVAAYRERDWLRLDHFIAVSRESGLRVILDLSTYRNLLRENGLNPYAADWGPWLRWMASRVNTETGVRYRDDPTIAIISIAGEPEPINGNTDPFAAASTQQLTDFYARTAGQLRKADQNHLISSGGLLQYGWNSGVDWRAIFRSVDVCALHGYSDSDLATVATIAAFCAGLGKPWLAEEFGYQQGIGDRARASAFQAIYDMARNNHAAGIGFWNLGPELASQSHDVNAETPATWATVRDNAPR